MKIITKKIILATVCIILGLGLSGCGSGLQDFAESQLPIAIRQRGEVNKQVAAKFQAIGAISEKQLKTINSHIDKQVAKYAPEKSGDSSTSAKVLGTIAQAVSVMHLGHSGNPSYIVFHPDDDSTVNLYYCADCDEYHENIDHAKESPDYVVPNDPWLINSTEGKELTNFVMSNYLENSVFKLKYKHSECHINRDWKDNNSGKDIEPIELISEDIEKSINEAIKAKLYILSSDLINTNDLNALDGVMANIQQTVNSNSKATQKAAELNAYFAEARDKDNKPIYLIDPEDKEYDMVQTSKPNNCDDPQTMPGYDLIIGQYDMTDCIHVRFNEFNNDALEKLNEFMGQNINKFWLLQDGEGEWRAYLMAYPIYAIDTMTLCENKSDWQSLDWAKDDGGYSTVGVEFKKSGLGVNLMTGQFIKYKRDANGGWNYSDGELLDLPTDQLYLTLSPAQNNDASARCSLVVNGVAEYSVKNTSQKTFTFYGGRILLRDYLEATYAPGYNPVSGEGPLEVFGRKIRFNFTNENFKADTSQTYKTGKGDVHQTVLVYDRGTPVAEFVDKNGEIVPGSPSLEITDFCDAKELMHDNPDSCTIYRLPFKNEEPFVNDKEITVDVPDTTDLSVDTRRTTINPVTWFPSPDIGKADYNTDSNKKQRFYCVATTKGMFGSALFSSWVESTVEDASLDWWIEYLQSNGFSYSLDHKSIVDYLSDNFKYQLSQNGVVILDLETIEKIQDMYDAEADQNRVGTIRTFFVILGWLLVFGSFLLLLLWVVDTNMDIGLGLLEKVTFGNWVAVRYEDDIPDRSANNQKYMTFKRIVIRVMILIAIGILIITVDIFYILTVVVDLFGELASQAEKIIKGRI